MANGPLEIFLKLDGIEGESTDAKHPNEIVVLSYEESISQTLIVTAGSGVVSAGRPSFSGVRFRKPVDKASVPLLLACASGMHIKDGLFTFRRTTGIEFYTIKLSEILVTRVLQVAGSGTQYPLSFDSLNASADRAGFLDEVTLDYGKIEWQYQPVLPNGTLGTPVKGGWDVRQNRKI